MPNQLKISFAAPVAPSGGVLVVFVDASLKLASESARLLPDADALIVKAAAALQFKGKPASAMEIVAPQGINAERLIVIGAGPAKANAKDKDATPEDYVTLGGLVMGKIGSAAAASVLFDLPHAPASATEAAADFMLGMQMRGYRFDLYKTKKKDDEPAPTRQQVTIGVADAASARKAAKAREAVAEGVIIARNLVNEPPNVLTPVEFAKRAAECAALGVEVEVLDMKALAKLGMRALLAVGQGSALESRVVIMRWNGAKDAKAQPVAFIGKGVTFDTGGISIKGAAGMEDMKGDMGGAACVTGLMHALASRKAKVNAIGAIGLVENMPDGNAQRPGDIVKSMSGQTIEIINTDAEGRLVLADVLWHIQTKFKPQFMVDLATLTGAILVALGQEHAGMFSNNDALCEKLSKAGIATGEKVWRLPMGPAYDKLIDSKFADMKNTGGRHGGSITAAHFLQRFVGDTPWAHLDVAGTAMGSPASEINQSWGSGWGVRLLDRLVADNYEK
jgi:leucyl aminopeptidase